MTPEQRLKLVPRVVHLLRLEIAKNGGRYDGGMVPNLTSIQDLCVMPSGALGNIEAQVAELERAREIYPEGS
jgi:hypothetical protein